MPRYTVKVANTHLLKRKLKELPDDMLVGLTVAVRAAAKQLKADARKRAPVRSGDLRRSIRYRMDRDGLGAQVYVDEFYGRFIEYGTKSMEKQPFLRPAAALERARFRNRVSDEVRKALGLD
ncbi:HK97-gp10 family putative phage morphogenesis protein [Glycomyces paridis]|uniref:HK97 gp10 family phage protein n=1 Tax=Glycomyces paridis TaxID=2126555 RepID=A0A4S8PHR6_9ACTN|nr:HK97-gp10 family putative phage morphogenesis protein [Glycomyces paridis]THV27939.1 hypothetical protein E9998_13190 [Glycomyces paridis]